MGLSPRRLYGWIKRKSNTIVLWDIWQRNRQEKKTNIVFSIKQGVILGHIQVSARERILFWSKRERSRQRLFSGAFLDVDLRDVLIQAHSGVRDLGTRPKLNFPRKSIPSRRASPDMRLKHRYHPWNRGYNCETSQKTSRLLSRRLRWEERPCKAQRECISISHYPTLCCAFLLTC